MEITAVCVPKHDKLNGVKFEFTFRSEDFQSKIVLVRPNTFCKKDWEDFISAIENNNSECLNFYQGGGEGSTEISCDGEFVSFTGMPMIYHGEIEGEKVTFRVPLFKYKEKLVKIFNSLINDPVAIALLSEE